MAEKKRELWADYAKGICILLVFIGHSDAIPQAVRIFIYLFHMPMFFFCMELHGIIPSALRYNEEFRDMFLTRLGEMLRGPLSDENAQKTLDELRAIVEPESARDLARWGKSSTLFATQMANLRGFVSGRAARMQNEAIAFFGISAEDAAKYFG